MEKYFKAKNVFPPCFQQDFGKINFKKLKKEKLMPCAIQVGNDDTNLSSYFTYC